MDVDYEIDVWHREEDRLERLLESVQEEIENDPVTVKKLSGIRQRLAILIYHRDRQTSAKTN